ncbi:PEGA domain-containing protein [Haloferula helveola]|uniref:PEGA domain-containing protein n=1 Tax=Haloferula helveola TaxID=490095 RepID=A0ABN6H910_9BACT|nr:PEGA domain-containing protein [Haloferula helveola]
MPTTRVRPDPKIPDHEVLRRIGGGAYGEVWLARGVTGALRAVKVLWREDFEDERSFEREFEGILKYEPISRDHPGLVNVLHVGRSLEGPAFYYYVMELGDDIVSGGDINPIEYEARTVRSDVKRAGGKRLDTGLCIEVGQRLAEALKHLHDSGLAHRDVKPANVIFVNGKAKLADIGLVATRGQRTFVGTEGFVPPEGPGSAQADVYSLGKVLYEMATGKDRLDFPELPDELPDGPERRQWLALNQVICDVCEPHVSRRTIRTAGELGEALNSLRTGRHRRRRRPIGAFLMSMLLGVGLMWGGWEAVHRSPLADAFGLVPPPTPPAPPRKAFIKVTSTPDGADVIDVVDRESGMGELIGRTPTDVLDSYVGEELSLRILRDGYQPYEVTTVVPMSAAEEPLVISAVLKVYSPPAQNEPWTDQVGVDYRPLGEGHESVGPVGEKAWKAYAEAEQRPQDVAQIIKMDLGGKKVSAVVTSDAEAKKYCEWLVRAGVEQGYLTTDHEALPQFQKDFPKNGLKPAARKENWKPFRVLVRRIPYSRVMVETVPPGAEIYLNGLSQGSSSGPLLLDQVRPGRIELMASLEGYKSETRTINLGEKEFKELKIELRKNKSVVITDLWDNSLGMRMIPAGDGWMVAAWETRRSDYQAYVRATGARLPELPIVGEKEGEHPVVSVSREESEAFCEWLTEKERKEDRLTRSLEYRLPTDFEWSELAGTMEIAGTSPATRDRLKPRIFFWGANWPPVAAIANLGPIEGFQDGYDTTAPVGSFPANENGVFDLCGNVQEWVSDSYSRLNNENGVLRGGSWGSVQEKDLYVGSRNPQPPDATDPTYGFRVVLAKKKAEPAEDPDEESEDEDGSDPD